MKKTLAQILMFIIFSIPCFAAEKAVTKENCAAPRPPFEGLFSGYEETERIIKFNRACDKLEGKGEQKKEIPTLTAVSKKRAK